MRALTLIADRNIELADRTAPPAPAADEVQIQVKAVGLNHFDVWGWRGMAFAKRKLPLVIGAEAAGEITAVGSDVTALSPGCASFFMAPKPAGPARPAERDAIISVRILRA